MRAIKWRFVLGYTVHLTVTMMVSGGLLLYVYMRDGDSFPSALARVSTAVSVGLIATVFFMMRFKGWLKP